MRSFTLLSLLLAGFATAAYRPAVASASDATTTADASSGNPDYLRLLVYPSIWGISWDSPTKLAGWIVANKGTGSLLSPHNIGHSDVELFCKGVNHDGVDTHIFTGQTGGLDMGSAVLAGEGLGILTYSYAGDLYDSDHVQASLAAAAHSSTVSDPLQRLGFLEIQINPKTCDRLLTYFNEYKARHYYKQYGFRNRPRYGEGGICTAFGVSFLDLAGVLTPEMTSYWQTSIRVPSALAGKPTLGENPIDEFAGNGSVVSDWELLGLIDPYTTWPTADQQGIDVTLNDPDKMFDWIDQRVTYAQHNPRAAQWVEFDHGSFKGIVLDRTSTPTPTDPIWRGRAAEGYVYSK